MFETEIPDFSDIRRKKLIDTLQANNFDKNNLNSALGQSWHTPFSTFLNHNLAEELSPIFESPKEYDIAYDIFEYFLTLNYLHICGNKYGNDWVPWGESQWRRNRFGRNDDNPMLEFFGLAEKLKAEWPPLKEGQMFNGAYDTYTDIAARVREFLKGIHLH